MSDKDQKRNHRRTGKKNKEMRERENPRAQTASSSYQAIDESNLTDTEALAAEQEGEHAKRP